MALKNGYPFYFSVVVCLCTSPLEIVVSIVSGSTEDFEKGTCFLWEGGEVTPLLMHYSVGKFCVLGVRHKSEGKGHGQDEAGFFGMQIYESVDCNCLNMALPRNATTCHDVRIIGRLPLWTPPA